MRLYPSFTEVQISSASFFTSLMWFALAMSLKTNVCAGVATCTVHNFRISPVIIPPETSWSWHLIRLSISLQYVPEQVPGSHNPTSGDAHLHRT